jgi:pantoate--beta-alanine ligase
MAAGLTEDTIPVVRTVAALRAVIAGWRRDGMRVGLVPTMGALHDGHVALLRKALDAGERSVVSIFVNPTQFGPTEDFAAYPRREASDLARLASEGAHLAWMPTVEEMYPSGFSSRISTGKLTEILEGEHRPGHFDGVATIVAKLLLQVLPDSAYFGEKDYQQLMVVRRLVCDLNIPVRIEGVPIVRDADGLALSSRNVYLSADERRRAVTLPQVLRQTAAAAAGLGRAAPLGDLVERAEHALSQAGFGPVDYVAICDTETLQPLEQLDRPARILGAARMGRTRLIDNMPVP